MQTFRMKFEHFNGIINTELDKKITTDPFLALQSQFSLSKLKSLNQGGPFGLNSNWKPIQIGMDRQLVVQMSRF